MQVAVLHQVAEREGALWNGKGAKPCGSAPCMKRLRSGP